jgi:WD40 repeat protein
MHCAISPDGKYVVSGAWIEGFIHVWDADTGEPLWILAEEGGSVQFSPDGRWLAAHLQVSHRVRLWKTGTWEPGPTLGPPVAELVAFAPDGSLLAFGGEAGFVVLVRPETGEEVARLFTPDRRQLSVACFTPEGSRLLALGLESQTYYVWDLFAIRGRLRDLGLDWDERPPERPARPERPPEPLGLTVRTTAGPP